MSIERPPQYYDSIYKTEREYTQSYQKSKYFRLWTRALTLIPRYLNIVELGCGTGQFAEMLSVNDHAMSYAGFDFSRDAISIARARRQWAPVYGFYEQNIALPGVQFDGNFFVSFETLEHTRDFDVIHNIPLGYEFVFTVPDFDDPGHVRYFHSINQVVRRYHNHLLFSHVEKFESWYLCKAKTV